MEFPSSLEMRLISMFSWQARVTPISLHNFFLGLWYNLVTSVISCEKQHPLGTSSASLCWGLVSHPVPKHQQSWSVLQKKLLFTQNFGSFWGIRKDCCYLSAADGISPYGHSIRLFLLSTRVWGENQKSDLVKTHLSASVRSLCAAPHWQAPHKNPSVSPEWEGSPSDTQGTFTLHLTPS